MQPHLACDRIIFYRFKFPERSDGFQLSQTFIYGSGISLPQQSCYGSGTPPCSTTLWKRQNSFYRSIHPRANSDGVSSNDKENETEAVLGEHQATGVGHSLLPSGNIEGEVASCTMSLQWRRWGERRSGSEAEKFPPPEKMGAPPCQNWCRNTTLA